MAGSIYIRGLRPETMINTEFRDVYIKDIAKASSAAYPFLSATEIKGHYFVDGGFLFNNVDILVTHFLLN